jgi:hypothetical protein
MNGNGDLVVYTRFFEETLDAQKKKDLKKKINKIIDDAAGAITIIALVEAVDPEEAVEQAVKQKKELEAKKARKKVPKKMRRKP